MPQKKQEEKKKTSVARSPLTDDLNKKLYDISSKKSSLKTQAVNRKRSVSRKQAGSSSAVPGLSRLGSSPDIPRGYSKKSR